PARARPCTPTTWRRAARRSRGSGASRTKVPARAVLRSRVGALPRLGRAEARDRARLQARPGGVVDVVGRHRAVGHEGGIVLRRAVALGGGAALVGGLASGLLGLAVRRSDR